MSLTSILTALRNELDPIFTDSAVLGYDSEWFLLIPAPPLCRHDILIYLEDSSIRAYDKMIGTVIPFRDVDDLISFIKVARD